LLLLALGFSAIALPPVTFELQVWSAGAVSADAPIIVISRLWRGSNGAPQKKTAA